jgi:cobyrinic acid a,c-diamide synthase
MQGWRDAGAEIIPFSPLADEAASQDADFIYLPGGYPELHLPALSAASVFQTSLRRAAKRDCLIYGECGGYMVLGSAIYGADGTYWPMANLLHLTTSFAAPKRTLGYRFLNAATGPFAGQWTGHEYHVTQAIEETGIPLFSVTDSLGEDRGKAGLCAGSVYGSYMHLIAKTA